MLTGRAAPDRRGSMRLQALQSVGRSRCRDVKWGFNGQLYPWSISGNLLFSAT